MVTTVVVSAVGAGVVVVMTARSASGLATASNDNADDGDHHKQHKTCYRDSHSNAHNAVVNS